MLIHGCVETHYHASGISRNHPNRDYHPNDSLEHVDVLQEDYIRTASAKGLAERVVLFRHALKNAFLL